MPTPEPVEPADASDRIPVLTDEQYRRIEPLIPPPKTGGRPRTADMRRILEGMLYVERTGCRWRQLPPPPLFPPWATVYGYYRGLKAAGVWETVRSHLGAPIREGRGRKR